MGSRTAEMAELLQRLEQAAQAVKARGQHLASLFQTIELNQNELIVAEGTSGESLVIRTTPPLLTATLEFPMGVWGDAPEFPIFEVMAHSSSSGQGLEFAPSLVNVGQLKGEFFDFFKAWDKELNGVLTQAVRQYNQSLRDEIANNERRWLTIGYGE